MQSGAGQGTGFGDDDYRTAGSRIVDRASVWESELVVKVKELQEAELSHARRGQAVFGFHHWVGHPELARAARNRRHRHRLRGRSRRTRWLPAAGTHVDHRGTHGHRRGHAAPSGRAPRKVLVLGAGHAGRAAAEAARHAGADVHVLRRATATPEAVEEHTTEVDLVVGAVFTAGEKTPKLLPRSLVARMKRGAMIVDISIEEGGVAQTSRPTSHDEPTFVEECVIHYAVPNMPSAVPREAAEAISAAVLPYVRALAKRASRTPCARTRWPARRTFLLARYPLHFHLRLGFQ